MKKRYIGDEPFAAVVAGEDGRAEEHGVCRYYFSVNLLASRL